MRFSAVDSDGKMQMTPLGIPVSLRPFFQEYDLEKIDPETAAFTVIERTLSWGDRRELRWLFRRYTREQMAAVVRDAGWRLISRYRFFYWLNVFEITEYRKTNYQRIWAHH
jgi:hypothetical protein